MTIRIVGLVAAVALLAAPVAAEDAPATYGAAMSWYQRGVASGDANAQYLAGVRTESGVAGAPDLAQALKLYALSAASGHLQAAYRLGRLRLEQGDAEGARQALRSVAEQGHVGAQSLLGYLLGAAARRPDDIREADYWLERAARAGDATAAENLARLAPLLGPEDRAAVAARLSQP